MTKNLIRILIGSTIILALGLISEYMLGLFGLQFRTWKYPVFLILLMIWILTLIMMLVNRLFMLNKIMGTITAIIFFGGYVYVFGIISLYLWFSNYHETVTTHNDNKVVGVIYTSSMDIRVDYYEFQNFLVMGAEVVSSGQLDYPEDI